MSEPTSKTISQLIRVAGVDTPSQLPNKSVVQTFSTFSQSEYRNLLNGHNPEQSTTNNSLDNLLSTITKTSIETENWNREIEELKILTPEIDDAADLVVSSIFSPTDMQTNVISISCEKTELGEDLENEISSIMTTFFNDKLSIAEKAEKWIREARYGTGSSPIILLPASNITTLNTLSELNQKGELYNANSLDDIMDPSKSVEALVEQSTEAWCDSDSLYDKINNDLLFKSTEAINDLTMTINDSRDADLGKLDPTSIVHGKELGSLFVKLFKDKSIRFHQDLSVLTNNSTRSTKVSNSLSDKALQHLFGANQVKSLYTLDDDLNKNDNVVVIELDSSIVIPISVPNAPDQHLGYIVVVDQWGNPLTRAHIDDYYRNGSRSLNDMNAQTVTAKTFASQFHSDVTDKQRFDITTNMFTTAVKLMIKSKMLQYGFGEIDVSEHNALGGALFNYLLHDNKIGMVFVPAAFVIYVAFDYRKDGTGKSLIEDINTIVALRNTLTMAGIMAAAENSVNNRTIEVNVDEKNANPLQALETIRNLYIDKKVVKLNYNPMDIQRGLYQKSLTILPKNMKGLKEGLSTNIEHRSTGAVMPDENLREQLTKWIVTKLQVPKASMEEIGQNEFSRSIAINNLHFSNKLHKLQRTTEKHLNKFVRTYAMFSSTLRDKIRDVLIKLAIVDKKIKANDFDTAITSDMKKTANIKDMGLIDKYVDVICKSLCINLPKPRAVIDQAQYTEIEKYISTVEKIIDEVYPADVIDMYEYKQAHALRKAQIKSQLVRQFINDVGFQSNYELPDISSVNMKTLEHLVVTLINDQRNFNNIRQLFGKPINSADGDGSNITTNKELQDDKPENQNNDEFGGGSDNGGGDEFDNFDTGGIEETGGSNDENGGGDNEPTGGNEPPELPDGI